MSQNSLPAPPSFSVLTAVLPDRSSYLPAAAESVARVRAALPRGSVQWVVVIDGPGDVGPVEGADLVARLPSRQGVSAARNVALSHASGELVVPLDADDEVELEGLVAALDAFADPSLGWVGANRLLLDSREQTPHWHGSRRWVPGELAEAWTAPFPFHPNSFVARRRLVDECGGWPPLTTNEDLLLILLMSELAPGLSLAEVLTLYRVWPGQEVQQPSYEASKVAAFEAIAASVNVARADLRRPPITAPVAGGAHGIRGS